MKMGKALPQTARNEQPVGSFDLEFKNGRPKCRCRHGLDPRLDWIYLPYDRARTFWPSPAQSVPCKPTSRDIRSVLARLSGLACRNLREDAQRQPIFHCTAIDPEARERGVGRARTAKDARALAWINVFRHTQVPIPLKIPEGWLFQTMRFSADLNAILRRQ
jgi:hypothetical protein